MNAANPAARRRRWLRRALSLALGTAAALLAGELFARRMPLVDGRPWTGERARAWLDRRAGAARFAELAAFAAPDPQARDDDLRPVPHPWLGWSDPQHRRLFEEGARWFAGADAQATFDVLVLGGSFAAQFGNLSTPRLEAQLPRALDGRAVRVWNVGRAGYKQPQQVHLLLWLLDLGWKPDFVVCVDGFNEVAIAASNAAAGTHPLYPFATFWGTVARGGDLDVEGLDLLVRVRAAQQRIQGRAEAARDLGAARSGLATQIAMALLRGPDAELAAARAAYVDHLGRRSQAEAIAGPSGPRGAGELDLAIALGARGWREGAVALRAECAARGIGSLHVLQPCLADEGAKPASAAELGVGALVPTWERGVAVGYPLLRAACAELAAQGVPALDATRVFAGVQDTLYEDGCHLSPVGYDRFLDALLPRLAAAVASQAAGAPQTPR